MYLTVVLDRFFFRLDYSKQRKRNVFCKGVKYEFSTSFFIQFCVCELFFCSIFFCVEKKTWIYQNLFFFQPRTNPIQLDRLWMRFWDNKKRDEIGQVIIKWCNQIYDADQIEKKQNFRYLTKILVFVQNLSFWSKFKFLAKILVFGQNLSFCPKFKFLAKILVFGQNFSFWPKF